MPPKSCTKLKFLRNVWTLCRSWDNCRLPFRSTSLAIVGLAFPIGIFNSKSSFQNTSIGKNESAWQFGKIPKNPRKFHPFRKEKKQSKNNSIPPYLAAISSKLWSSWVNSAKFCDKATRESLPKTMPQGTGCFSADWGGQKKNASQLRLLMSVVQSIWLGLGWYWQYYVFCGRFDCTTIHHEHVEWCYF